MARRVVTTGSKAYQIEGMAELRANVEKILDRTSAENLKPVFMDGARVLLQEAQAEAPVGDPLTDVARPLNSKGKRTHDWSSGAFRRAMFIFPGDPTKPDVLFSVSYKIAPHAHWVEFGTSTQPPHATIRRAISTTRGLIVRTIADGFRAVIEAATNS